MIKHKQMVSSSQQYAFTDTVGRMAVQVRTDYSVSSGNGSKTGSNMYAIQIMAPNH